MVKSAIYRGAKRGKKEEYEEELERLYQIWPPSLRPQTITLQVGRVELVELFGLVGGLFGLVGGLFGLVGGLFGLVSGLFGLVGGLFGLGGGLFGLVGGLFGLGVGCLGKSCC